MSEESYTFCDGISATKASLSPDTEQSVHKIGPKLRKKVTTACDNCKQKKAKVSRIHVARAMTLDEASLILISEHANSVMESDHVLNVARSYAAVLMMLQKIVAFEVPRNVELSISNRRIDLYAVL